MTHSDCTVSRPNTRLSNFELLRILAMFLVLIVHCNYRFLGVPTTDEAREFILPTFARVSFQNISIVCVNLFVMISGWFGAKLQLGG